MSTQSFDVTYKIRLGNLTAFFAAWWTRSWLDKASWIRFGIYAVALLVVFASPLWAFGLGKYTVGYAPGFIVFMAFFLVGAALATALVFTFLIAPLLTYAAQLASFALGSKRRQSHHLQATTAAVSKTIDDVETRTQWQGFTRIVNTKTTVLLFTSRNSATIIPKSAFASPAAAEAFATFAKTQWDEARSVF